MTNLDSKIDQLNEVSKFIILLLRAEKFSSIPGMLWLEKEVFLLKNVFPTLADETDYEPYLMGPHSEIVENEVEELIRSGIIKVEKHGMELSSIGKQISNILMKSSAPKEIQKIEDFKLLLNDLSKDELLTFIYFSYPSTEELEKESIEYKPLLSKRKKLAIRLYHKGKISAQRASQISGLSFEDFIQELKRDNSK